MTTPKTVGFMVSMLLVLAFFAFSCDSDSPLEASDNIRVMKSLVSECGGFDATLKRAAGADFILSNQSTYSDAERLQWIYDEETETVHFLNSCVSLNCCGLHDINAVLDTDVIVISENDQAEPGVGRCRCACWFDFSIDVSGVSPGVISVRLDRTVDDATENKWEGEINLGEGSGAVIIDNTPPLEETGTRVSQ